MPAAEANCETERNGEPAKANEIREGGESIDNLREGGADNKVEDVEVA